MACWSSRLLVITKSGPFHQSDFGHRIRMEKVRKWIFGKPSGMNITYVPLLYAIIDFLALMIDCLRCMLRLTYCLFFLSPAICLFFLWQKGNDFGEEFDDLQFVERQVMVVSLKVEEPKIIFSPPLQDCCDIIQSCFLEIIESGKGLPRVCNFAVKCCWIIKFDVFISCSQSPNDLIS